MVYTVDDKGASSTFPRSATGATYTGDKALSRLRCGAMVGPRFESARDASRARGVLREVGAMKKEYDISKAKKNPYANRLNRQITIRVDDGGRVTSRPATLEPSYDSRASVFSRLY